MNKLFLFYLLFTTAPIILNGQKCVIPLDHRYKGEDSDNHGTTTTQGALITGINTAFYFNGDRQYRKFPSQTLGGALSFSFWAKPDEIRDSSRIIDFGTGPYGHNIIIFMVENGASRFNEFKGYDQDKEAPDRIQQYGGTFIANQWVQFTITIDNDGNTKIYKNGELSNTPNGNKSSTKIDSRPRDLNYMGKSHFYEDPYYKGAIDKFLIFERELSATEAKCLGSKENYCIRQCKQCYPDFDNCSSCIGTLYSNGRKANTCHCKINYYDSGQDNCQKYTECQERHQIIKITSFSKNSSNEEAFFETSKLDTLMGNSNWNRKNFQAVNIRNGKFVTYSLSRQNSSQSKITYSSSHPDFHFQTNDEIDFQKLGCKICVPQNYKVANNECKACDNSKCALCVNSATGCTKECGTTCKTCDYEAHCTSCKLTNEYIASDDKTCKKCNVQCATCKNTGENCLICSDYTTRKLNQKCVCNSRYFQDGNNIVCSKCAHQCDQCTIRRDNCNGCSDTETRDSSNSCQCKDGYYNQGTNFVCERCDKTKCATCTSITNCTLACGDTCKTCGTDGKCLSCEDGRYLNNGECKKCSIQCLKCETNADNCQGCSDYTTRNPSKNCLCISKHFQDGNNIVCGKCDHQCNECEFRKDNCKGCSHNTRDPGNKCECNLGYYNVGTQEQCLRCDNSKCATCSSETVCTLDCGGTCKTCRTDGKCDTCEEIGRYLHSGVCETCAVQCKSCSGSDSHCIECSDNNTRNLNSNQCTCKTQHFQEGNNAVCGKCSYKCDECEGDKFSCKACSDEKRIHAQGCKCEPGYFDDGSNAECKICDNTKCATCTSRTTCDIPCGDTCKTCGLDGRCLTCQDIGEFLDNGECKPCDVQCNKCTGRADFCTECSDTDTDTRDFNDNKCTCKHKYFQDGNNAVCGKCDHQCDKCETTKENCIGCSHDTRDESNSCECKPGFFNQGTNPNCAICDHTKCATCVSQNDNCIKPCDEGCEACNSTGSCTACNPNGEYEKDGNCEKCALQCGSCETNADNCKTCSEPNRDYENYCFCKSKFFQNGDSIFCGRCEYQCDQCKTESNNCVGCSHPTRDLSNNCQCKPGYFNIGQQEECIKCNNRKCGTCISLTSCIVQCGSTCSTCNLDGSCATCKLGQYLDKNDKICKPCPFYCLTCINGQKCDQCKKEAIGRSIDAKGDNCSCLEGYYQIQGQINCIKCEPGYCKECNIEGQCLKCKNEQLLPPDCQIDQKGSFYVLETGDNNILNKISHTGQCHFKCKACHTNYEQCSVCNNGLYRQQNPPCNCLLGFHDNNGQAIDCIKCPKYCLECINGDKCLRCEDIQNIEINEFNQQCQCKKGFKEMNNKCVRCYSYYDDCVYQCPDFMVQNNSTFECESPIMKNIEAVTDSGYNIILLFFAMLFAVILAKAVVGVYFIKKYSRIREEEHAQFEFRVFKMRKQLANKFINQNPNYIEQQHPEEDSILKGNQQETLSETDSSQDLSLDIKDGKLREQVTDFDDLKEDLKLKKIDLENKKKTNNTNNTNNNRQSLVKQQQIQQRKEFKKSITNKYEDRKVFKREYVPPGQKLKKQTTQQMNQQNKKNVIEIDTNNTNNKISEQLKALETQKSQLLKRNSSKDLSGMGISPLKKGGVSPMKKGGVSPKKKGGQSPLKKKSQGQINFNLQSNRSIQSTMEIVVEVDQHKEALENSHFDQGKQIEQVQNNIEIQDQGLQQEQQEQVKSNQQQEKIYTQKQQNLNISIENDLPINNNNNDLNDNELDNSKRNNEDASNSEVLAQEQQQEQIKSDQNQEQTTNHQISSEQQLNSNLQSNPNTNSSEKVTSNKVQIVEGDQEDFGSNQSTLKQEQQFEEIQDSEEEKDQEKEKDQNNTIEIEDY